MDVTAREANKKRKGMKNPTDEEEVPERDSKLVMALARLALQHESERRAHARDDNAVFSMPSSGELAKELQWAADKYAETGAQLKKEQGENYKGHPNGKKPDAMFASLLYRMHQAILTKVGGDSTTALERFVENSAHLEMNQKAVALQTLQVVAARANQPRAVRATRCFVVQSKKDEITKWIAAANGDPELSMALRVCKQIQLIKKNIGVESQTDQAPQSQAAKVVGVLACGAADENRSPRKSEKVNMRRNEYGVFVVEPGRSCHR